MLLHITFDMAKIIESRFRVLEILSEDIFLSDLEAGPPVHVEIDDESYPENLKKKLDSLEVGNLIKAEIRSEALAQEDALWFFLSIDIIEETRFHFIDRANSHPDVIEQYKNHLNKVDENSVRKFLSSDGDRIGYVTVAEAQNNDVWLGLQAGTKSHERDLNYLSNIGDPPYEVIYTRSKNEDHLIFYHFNKKGTDLAKNLVRAND